MKHMSFSAFKDVLFICVLVAYAGWSYYLWGKVEDLGFVMNVALILTMCALILLVNPMYRLYLRLVSVPAASPTRLEYDVYYRSSDYLKMGCTLYNVRLDAPLAKDLKGVIGQQTVNGVYVHPSHWAVVRDFSVLLKLRGTQGHPAIGQITRVERSK